MLEICDSAYSNSTLSHTSTNCTHEHYPGNLHALHTPSRQVYNLSAHPLQDTPFTYTLHAHASATEGGLWPWSSSLIPPVTLRPRRVNPDETCQLCRTEKEINAGGQEGLIARKRQAVLSLPLSLTHSALSMIVFRGKACRSSPLRNNVQVQA